MKTTKAQIVLVALLFVFGCGKGDRVVDVDARSGATPIALARAAPSDLALTVNGESHRHRDGWGVAPRWPDAGPVRDYFIDRDVWGLSHIVQLDLTGG